MVTDSHAGRKHANKLSYLFIYKCKGCAVTDVELRLMIAVILEQDNQARLR